MKALVIGSSGGIGGALVGQLEASARFEAVTTLSRSDDGLEITDESSIAMHLSRLKSSHGEFDLIIDATGALVIDGHAPEKTVKAITADAMAKQFIVNAVGPALLIKHSIALLPRGRRSVFATVSARVGSIGDNRLGGWISYRAAKAALNQIVKTSALEIARTHPQSIVVALHPGTVETRLSKPFASHYKTMTSDHAASKLLAVIDSLQPVHTGNFFSYDGSMIEW